MFEAHPVDLAYERHAQLVFRGLGAGGVEFISNGMEFAGVQPDAAAAGAFVDFDGSLGAEVASFEFDPFTAGALAFAGGVDLDGVVGGDVKEDFRGGVGSVFESVQFEGIEPYTAAAAFADIDRDFADGLRCEWVIAGGAFHGHDSNEHSKPGCGEGQP